MLKKIRENWHRGLIRPMIYQAFTRFILALTLSLLWDHFVFSPYRPMRLYAFLFFALLFGTAAWLAYLRMDHVKLPKLAMFRFQLKKKPVRTYGDMIDFVDEEIVSFDELENEEKDICLLFANLICCVIFLIASLL